jgi:dipeptidyl aminopeptidase/acylaminoacyl peptidase
MPDYREFLAAQRFQRIALSSAVMSLSADGTNVAYATDTSGQFNVWTQPAAGGPARQLSSFTDQSVRDIAWSPDGSQLAFTADMCGDEQTQIYLINAAGGPMTRLSRVDGRKFMLAEKTLSTHRAGTCCAAATTVTRRSWT